MTEHVNITPNPRILRTLGEIPFAAWQCIAELVDNSMDSLGKPWDLARPDDDKRIIVSWSRDNVAEGDRALEVKDTGPGMSLDVLQKCVAAGYSTNDPISFLGLFGMGFNIATARLGEKTLVMSSEEGTSEWVGVEIDFDHLIGRGTYDAPVIRLPKQLKSEHGTLVRVSKLKPGLFNELRNRGREIKRQLETIYSPILNTTDIEVLVQGTRLQRIQHCVWGTDRYVTHKGEPVPAVIEIDENLGIALFDTDRNRYVTESEENEYKTFHREKGALPKGIVQRERRIHGWLGIQRYAEPEDFGIDFIRNGRKILIGDTSLFGFRNPMTGRTHLEYPKELGTTVGGESSVKFTSTIYRRHTKRLTLIERMHHGKKWSWSYAAPAQPYQQCGRLSNTRQKTHLLWRVSLMRTSVVTQGLDASQLQMILPGSGRLSIGKAIKTFALTVNGGRLRLRQIERQLIKGRRRRRWSTTEQVLTKTSRSMFQKHRCWDPHRVLCD
ncbi:MAG: ATP-binding protein [bacterium]|nr:ATP-binding protein [bacterium]